MNKFEFLFTDIHGTVKEPKRPVSSSMLTAMDSFRFKGFNTSSPWAIAQQHFPLQETSWLNASSNGTQIHNSQGELILSHPLSREQKSAIVTFLREEPSNWWQISLIEEDSKEIREFVEGVCITHNPQTEKKAVQQISLGAFLDNILNTNLVAITVKSNRPRICVQPEYLHYVSPHYARPNKVTFTTKVANKKMALKYVCQKYGIQTQEVVVTGDSPQVDDAAMEISYGIAVGKKRSEFQFAQQQVRNLKELERQFKRLGVS